MVTGSTSTKVVTPEPITSDPDLADEDPDVIDDSSQDRNGVSMVVRGAVGGIVLVVT